MRILYLVHLNQTTMFARIRFPLFRSYTKVLIVLLGLLGFAVSCKHEDEYGTPMADYLLMGTVKSKTDQSVLPDIKVTMFQSHSQTNNSGYYEVAVLAALAGAKTYQVNFHDMDTINNGHFLDKDTTVNFPGTGYAGGDGGWFKGRESLTLNVFLEPKP
jgi:putative lipoprotein (rSAM/lipoprotein system)